MEGKPTKKPYKPYITSPRCRGGRGGLRPRGGHSGNDQGEGWPRSKGRFRGGRGGFSCRGRFREGSSIKAPLQRDPMYPVRLKIKTKIDVIIAIKGDTLQPIALKEIRLSLQSLLKGRSLRIILMPMGVQKNLSWLWPQPCPKPTKKLSPLCNNP